MINNYKLDIMINLNLQKLFVNNSVQKIFNF